MPQPKDLPESMRPLTRWNSLELRHARWADDVERLLDRLAKLLEQSGAIPAASNSPIPLPPPASHRRNRKPLVTAVVAVVVLGIIAGILAIAGVFSSGKPPTLRIVGFTFLPSDHPRARLGVRNDGGITAQHCVLWWNPFTANAYDDQTSQQTTSFDLANGDSKEFDLASTQPWYRVGTYTMGAEVSCDNARSPRATVDYNTTAR